MPTNTLPPHLKASIASAERARTRRFQRYLREMRTAGLTVEVTDDGRNAVWLPELNSDPAAFPAP